LFLRIFFIFCFFFTFLGLEAKVDLGVDVFFSGKLPESVRGKRVGLITNQSGVNRDLVSTHELFMKEKKGFSLVAIFSPEHGLFGAAAAEIETENSFLGKIPVYSLHGKTRRLTDEMLANVDVLIYDIQEIGCRSYTYASTLYYVMEEAAKHKIPVIVLDRPNPLGGALVDGPMLDKRYRSFLGYVDVPYCHGMTIGELARYFNGEYRVGCNLQVVPLRGWKRGMSFQETGLHWIPTSPYIPDADTPLFYATTGLIGQLSLLNIGIGYTLPFKVVGAPWMSSKEFADSLNAQHLPGVQFVPFHFTPQFGLYKGEFCGGALILITDKAKYRPVKVQFFILGMIKSLYPKEFNKRISALSPLKKELFCKAVGGEKIFSILSTEKYPAWKMAGHEESERQAYLKKRKKYLLYP
jgi:uncharacterized protein YbbC (DUF1343 family)